MEESQFMPNVPKADQVDHQEPKPEVWIVDDNDESNRSIVRALQFSLEGATIKTFDKGETAIQELEKIKGASGQMPKVIFMDYNLEKDQPGFSTGTEIITKIRQMGVEETIIVANSASLGSNKEMVQAGANEIMGKPMNLGLTREIIKKGIE